MIVLLNQNLKKLTFATRLEQRSIENRLAQVNNKLSLYLVKMLLI